MLRDSLYAEFIAIIVAQLKIVFISSLRLHEIKSWNYNKYSYECIKQKHRDFYS